MQEHQVTAAGQRHPLPQPFFVLATQNPIEMEGTRCPKRSWIVSCLTWSLIIYQDQEVAVVQQTTTGGSETIEPLSMPRMCSQRSRAQGSRGRGSRAVRRAIGAASRPIRTTPRISSMNGSAGVPVCVPPVPRARSQSAHAPAGAAAAAEDIQAVAAPVLRHRVLVNYRAEAEGMTTQKIIEQLLDQVKPNA